MIEIQGLQKIIDQSTVVDIEALSVQTGEIAAVIGAVGSGKDVLFELCIGRTRPTAGQLRLAGIEPFADRQAFSRHVGVLFAEDNLYQHRSALGNLAFHGRLWGLPKSRAQEVLQKVGLADQARTPLDKLPSGLARRLAFGRAILHHPQILLLAQPFARCDRATISLLSDLIKEGAQEEKTVLILAEDETHLTTLCDTFHILSQGRIVESYAPEEKHPVALPFKVPAKLEDKVVLLNPSDILYALAQDGRAFLRTAEGELPTQFTLTELEERLARSGFFRAHRGYLVNLQHVREVISFTRNSFTLVLDDAASTRIPLSKSSARELRELLDY